MLLVIMYFLWITPQTFSDVLEKGELRIGYQKFPDNGYVYNDTAFGFELKILEKYALKNNLKLKFTELDTESMSAALNINKIDIGIGGLTQHLIDQRLNNSTVAWDEQTICIIEKRTEGLKSKFDKDSIDTTIFVGKRLSDETIIAKLEDALPEPTILYGVEDERDLIKKLANGEVDYVATTLGRLRVVQSSFPNIRRVTTLKNIRPSLHWMLPKLSDTAFTHSINNFIQEKDTFIYKQYLSNKLFAKPKHFHFLDNLKFKEHIKTRLPEFEQWFKQAAKEYDLDWTLLASLAYQESRWKVEAVSPTKVRGIMQITTQTAKSLGIDNRLDAFSTIFAGAKYLKNLRERIPKRVQEPDRTRMALGSYNIGYGYILDAYKDARKGNFNAVTWEDIEKRLPTIHRISDHDEVDYDVPVFSRGIQAVKYVSRIYEFQEILRYYAAE